MAAHAVDSKAPMFVRQSRMRAGVGASLERSSLRADCPAMLGLAARRLTRYVRFALCARTEAASRTTKRAARAAASPVLLGAPEARRPLPAYGFAQALAVLPEMPISSPSATVLESRQAASGRGDFCGDEKRRGGIGARSARRDLTRRIYLTRRICLSAESAANAASYAARPRAEHRSGVGALRRPPQHEPRPDAACRDARSQESLPNSAYRDARCSSNKRRSAREANS